MSAVKYSRVVILIGLALVLASCSPEEQPMKQETASTSSPALPPGMARAASAAQPGQQRRIAMSHSFTLRMPASAIAEVQQRHIDACLKSDCTILNSSLTSSDNGAGSASLSVRIAPAAYDEFAKSLAAKPARIVTHSETAEDKTAAILDVEARLKSKKALRDQLEKLMKQPERGTLADLLSIERELSNVQGEIESAEAQYGYLTKLTDTIKIDVSYYTDFALAPISDFAPIAEAAHKIKSTFAHSVAALITFLAGIVPWLPVIALVIWSFRWLWRRLRKRA